MGDRDLTRCATMPWVRSTYEEDSMNHDDLDTVRGILWGVILSIPLWGLLAYLFWRVL